MHISHIGIRNFRAIEDISVDLSPHINVVVGPNGVGKTTILQAVRLAKAIAAPRTQNEASQVLISLGAASPHFPQHLFLDGLARDATQQTEIRTTYTLRRDEIDLCRANIQIIARNATAGRLGLNFINQAQLLQFLQSPQGMEASRVVGSELEELFARFDRDPTIMIGLSLNPVTGDLRILEPLASMVFGHLDQRLPPSLSIFSYFPADRRPCFSEHNQYC